jgi:hypothetical protein
VLRRPGNTRPAFLDAFDGDDAVARAGGLFKFELPGQLVHFGAQLIQHFLVFAVEKAHLAFHHAQVRGPRNSSDAGSRAFAQLVVDSGLFEAHLVGRDHP